MPVDYVVDETLTRKENNDLLDLDTGLPNPGLTSRSEIALAAVAASLHEHQDTLSEDQLEQIAGWAKRWKISRSRRQGGSRNDFFAVLDVLQKSDEQEALVKTTYWKLLASWVSGLVFAIALLALAIGNWGDVDIGWGWQAGLGIMLFIAYICTSGFLTDALLLAKEQDRRYALTSLRKASTVYELNQAGLFTYLPNTSHSEPGFDDRIAMRVIRDEVERLTDALYNDPECWLLSTEYPWSQGDSHD